MCSFPGGQRDEHVKPIPITEYFTGPTAEKDGNAWLDSMLVKRIQEQALRPDKTTFARPLLFGPSRRKDFSFRRYYGLC